jgi:hypothetical protein
MDSYAYVIFVESEDVEEVEEVVEDGLNEERGVGVDVLVDIGALVAGETGEEGGVKTGDTVGFALGNGVGGTGEDVESVMMGGLIEAEGVVPVLGDAVGFDALVGNGIVLERRRVGLDVSGGVETIVGALVGGAVRSLLRNGASVREGAVVGVNTDGGACVGDAFGLLVGNETATGDGVVGTALTRTVHPP